MTITLELPTEVESRLRAEADAEGSDPAAIVTALLSDAFAVPAGAVVPASATAIREALDETHQEQARGELLTVDEAFAELNARAERRRQERSKSSAARQ